MFRKLGAWLRYRVARLRYPPRIHVDRSRILVHLGTEYGGWIFEPSDDLQNSTIVSCGLGEDASFDVEFASRFNAKVIVVDPTPRAISHFTEMMTRVGKAAEETYSDAGKLTAKSYNLSKVSADTLVLEPSAIWIEKTKLRFFPPANPDHVSHSIVNYQNNYRTDLPYIEVDSITLEDIKMKYGLDSIPLIKLDIEGAEDQVIRYMMEKSIRPRQILVEFDEMFFPTKNSQRIAEEIDSLLRQSGYLCRFFNGSANFLYVRES